MRQKPRTPEREEAPRKAGAPDQQISDQPEPEQQRREPNGFAPLQHSSGLRMLGGKRTSLLEQYTLPRQVQSRQAPGRRHLQTGGSPRQPSTRVPRALASRARRLSQQHWHDKQVGEAACLPDAAAEQLQPAATAAQATSSALTAFVSASARRPRRRRRASSGGRPALPSPAAHAPQATPAPVAAALGTPGPPDERAGLVDSLLQYFEERDREEGEDRVKLRVKLREAVFKSVPPGDRARAQGDPQLVAPARGRLPRARQEAPGHPRGHPLP